MKFLDNLSLILVIVGALNWGSIGLFGFDFVGFLFGGQLSMLSRIILHLLVLQVFGQSHCCLKTKFLRMKDEIKPLQHGILLCCNLFIK